MFAKTCATQPRDYGIVVMEGRNGSVIRCKTALVMRCCAAVALLGLGGGDKDTGEEEASEAERGWAEHGLGWLTGCVLDCRRRGGEEERRRRWGN